MTRLVASDLAAVAAFARDLADRVEGELGSPALLDGLLELVRADGIEWGTTDIQHRHILEMRHYPPLVVLPSDHPILTNGIDEFWRDWHACPVCGPSRQRLRGAFRLSDAADRSAAHPVHSWCAGFEVAHQLNLFIKPRDSFVRHFALSRLPGLDFSERDRQVVELAGVFLTQEIRSVESRRDARAALAAFEAGDPDERRTVIVLDAAGHPAVISLLGRALLNRYFDWNPWAHQLPPAMERWLAEADLIERVAQRPRSSLPPTRRIGRTGELVMRSASVDGQVVVILEEHRISPMDPRSVLTAREREVVDAVAQGLSNAQIADQLGVTAATVGKHLEHAFAKLNVRSRAAAVAMVNRHH